MKRAILRGHIPFFSRWGVDAHKGHDSDLFVEGFFRNSNPRSILKLGLEPKNLYWKSFNGSGVYEDSLKLVRSKDKLGDEVIYE